MKITLEIKYNIQPNYPNGTHTYPHSFIPAEGIFCPKCISAQVWVEAGPGDYYDGPAYYCLWCRRRFHVDVDNYVHPPGDTSPDGQILDQISAQINGRS